MVDFPFGKRIETTDRLPTRRNQNSFEITVRFKTTDRLLAVQGKTIVEKTV